MPVKPKTPPPPPRQKIVIATNSLANTQYEAYTNHIQFYFRLGRNYPNIDFIVCNPSRMSIDRFRNLAAKVALEVDADYLLFLDDDVLIQPDGLAKLLACNADIAAGKIVIRGYPFNWMVFKHKGKRGLYPCSKLPTKGVEKCDAVGFSFCLIKVDLLKRVPTINQPFFVTGINNTEDIYFCVRAREADPKCTIVCECSVHCGHILWPEVMSPTNRDAYKAYYSRINPQVQLEIKTKKLEKAVKGGDRGLGYLREVEEALSEEKTAKA